MKALVACEESQAVTIELRRLGVEAYSCDIQECSGGHPEWHLKQDVVPLLSEQWDLIIAHPPCTDLAVSGARHFARKRADGSQQRSIDFFMQFTNLDCPHVAIENPFASCPRFTASRIRLSSRTNSGIPHGKQRVCGLRACHRSFHHK